MSDPNLLTGAASCDVDVVAFRRDGYVLLDDCVAIDALGPIRAELADLLRVRMDLMRARGVSKATQGTAHHLIESNSRILDWLRGLADAPVLDIVRQELTARAVLNSLGAVDNQGAEGQYVANVHRDVRRFASGPPTMLQLLVALDDFLPENGATRVMPGSHLRNERPIDELFARESVQVLPRAGEAVLFDSRLWHAAGVNRTKLPRRALTLTLTPPYFKPQFDYCRYLGYGYVETLPASLQELLGYFARVPASLDEWYEPPERRFYQSSQG